MYMHKKFRGHVLGIAVGIIVLAILLLVGSASIASAENLPLSGKIIIIDPGHGLAKMKDGSFHFARPYYEVVTVGEIEKIYPSVKSIS